MVARPYLRTPRARVIQVTQLLHRKQQDFLLALSRGVIPDEIDQSGLEPRFVQHLNLCKLLLFCCCCGILYYFDIHPLLFAEWQRLKGDDHKHHILNTCLGQIIISIVIIDSTPIKLN